MGSPWLLQAHVCWCDSMGGRLQGEGVGMQHAGRKVLRELCRLQTLHQGPLHMTVFRWQGMLALGAAAARHSRGEGSHTGW